MKKKILFYMFFISVSYLFADTYRFTEEEKQSVYSIMGWDFGYLDLRNGNNFGSYVFIENFNSKKDIGSYEIKTYEENSKDTKLIQAIFENGKMKHRIYYNNEKNEDFFIYDKFGRISKTKTLRASYEDGKKIISDSQKELFSYEIKLNDNGYQILKQDYSNLTGKKTYRQFIFENGNLKSVIDGKILKSGKLIKGISYFIEYEGRKVISIKTYNSNGTLRNEQIVTAKADKVIVDEISYANSKVVTERKWILSDFDEKENWLQALCFSEGRGILKVLRTIEYLK